MQEQSYCSNLQFDFSKGVGYVEASYVISETANQAAEQGDQVFAYLLDVRKHLILSGIMACCLNFTKS